MSALIQYARNSLATYMSTDACTPAPARDARAAALHASLAALSGGTRVKTPKLVVVGTQSSGKSSLLNALVGVPLLPTGESMTTRAAVNVQLLRSDEAYVEVGSYVDGAWNPTERTALSAPISDEEARRVRDGIARETARLLGAGRGIVRDEPVHVRLASPTVPHLSFLDLPGITMTALTSEGQPADMCEQVRALIASHIDERTLVLLVCAARRDLEADAAVELCMSLTRGRGTVGCLTKTDLCDSDEAILTYLEGRHAPELALEHGYFAVMCKDTVAEQAHFASRPALAKRRTGTWNLAQHLQGALERMIAETLPELRIELETLHETTLTEHAGRIATPTLDGPAERVAYCHDLLGGFCAHMQSVVTGRRPDAGVGRDIRDAFSHLRRALRRHDPFCADGLVTDERILLAVANSEGWSMMSPAPPIEIVEFFVRDAPERPVRAVLPLCMECVDTVQRAVSDECAAAASRAFDRYAPLREWVDRALARLFAEFRTSVARDVERALDVEEAYVFTDDEDFAQTWAHSVARECDAAALRRVLSAYHAVVVDALAHAVPKIVVLHVRRTLRAMPGELVRSLADTDVERLLVETEEVEQLRVRLNETLHRTRACLRAIDALSP